MVEQKFNGELSADFNVIFENPDKAKATFIDGNWREFFWTIDDMTDLATNIGQALYHTPEQFKYNSKTGGGHWEKTPEGFGVYVKKAGSDVWEMTSEETGRITVQIDDVQAQLVHETTQS